MDYYRFYPSYPGPDWYFYDRTVSLPLSISWSPIPDDVDLPPDVAVTSVQAYCPRESLYPITKGYTTWTDIKVNVTVENQGDSTETSTVAAYAEGPTKHVIGTESVTLAPQTSRTITFTWNPSGMPICTIYTISAEASIVPGELETADNYLADGTFKLKYLADANGDDFVDITDLVILGLNWFKPVPPANAQADFSFDAFIDITDLVILGQNWFKGSGVTSESGDTTKEAGDIMMEGGTTKVYVDPEISTAAIGNTFTIDITVSGVENLYGWSIGMKFNASVLQCISFEEGPLLKQGGSTISASGTIDNENGTIYPPYGYSLTESGSVNGTGVLASITFKVIGVGDSHLNLTNVDLVKIVEGKPEHIPFEAMNGHFEKWHDIAVTNVTLSYDTTVVYPTWIYSPKIKVTVKNEGVSSETFDVTAYYEDVTGTYPIETQTVINLAPEANTTLTFAWDVPPLPGYPNDSQAAWPYPTYTISAEASVVPHEVETSDNAYVYGTVQVQWPGDANGDGHVNDNDKAILDTAWSKKYGEPGYDPRADFNGDGYVDITDIIIYSQNKGKGPLD